MRVGKTRSKRVISFPVRTQVGIFDAWKYEVVQTRSALRPPAFQSWRTGICERQKRAPQMLGRMYHDTLDEAKRACEKTLERAKKATAIW